MRIVKQNIIIQLRNMIEYFKFLMEHLVFSYNETYEWSSIYNEYELYIPNNKNTYK